MYWKALPALGLCLLALCGIWAPVDAQHAGAFMGSPDDPAVGYSTTPLNNAVVEVNKKIQDGTVQLAFDGRSGFLRSALEALRIPVDSQLLVFSRASLQRKRISEQNPRALFFNDRVALGWVRDGDVLEVAADDASTAVQAGLRMPRVSRDGQYAGRARPADVQHNTARTVSVFRSSAPH